jgi:hypothetical protein
MPRFLLRCRDGKTCAPYALLRATKTKEPVVEAEEQKCWCSLPHEQGPMILVHEFEQCRRPD